MRVNIWQSAARITIFAWKGTPCVKWRSKSLIWQAEHMQVSNASRRRSFGIVRTARHLGRVLQNGDQIGLGHSTSEVTELYYIRNDPTALEGITDGFDVWNKLQK